MSSRCFWPRSAASLSISAFLLALTACGDEQGGFASVDLADIEVYPTNITFNQIAIGETEVATITVENNGGADLLITSFEWVGSADDFFLDGLEGLVVPASSARQFTITYAPSDDAPDDATLVIDTNSGEVEVTVTSLGQAAVLHVQPATVDLLAEEVGRRTEVEVTLLNGGTQPFTIGSVALITGSTEFQMAPQFVTPAQLGVEQSVTLLIAYNPSGAGTDDAILLIEHDAANAVDGATQVPVTGSVRAPQLVADPDFVGFGAVAQDATATEIVQLRNEGQTTLRISDLYMDFQSSEDMGIVSLDGNPFVDGDVPDVEVAPDAWVELEVFYAPSDAEADNAQVMIVSNDPDFPIYALPMGGRLSGPVLSVTPEVLGFGSVAQGIERPLGVVIRNVGTEPLQLDPPAIDGGGHFTMVNAGLMPASLEPDQGFELVVSFSPLADGNLSGSLTVTAPNDPFNSPAEVLLTGFGAGEAICEIQVSPVTIDFGLVPRGTSRTGRAAVRNAGTGNCRINQVRVSPPPFGGFPPFDTLFSDAFSLVDAGIAPNTILGPGEHFIVEAQYAPISFTEFSEDLGDTSSIDILVTDMADTTREVTCGAPDFFNFAGFARLCGVNLRARSGVAELAAIPSEVDFGLVTRGCNSQQTAVNIYNIGSAPVRVTRIALEDCTPEFTLTGVPATVTPSPGHELVSGSPPLPVYVTFEPTDLGESSCNLVIESDAAAAGYLVVPLVGAGTDSSSQTDHFEQVTGRKVDVLFVVDNSGSMSEEQANLAANFATFIAAASTWGTDFQLGVITTEADHEYQGRLPGELMGTPRILHPDTPNLANEFSANALVGDVGMGDEHGLEAAYLALTDPNISDVGTCGAECVAPYACVANATGTESRCGGYNRSFVRDDASLELVFVSDEEDQSRGSVEFYIDFFRSIKGAGNQALFHASSIVGPRGGCSTAEAGNRYLDVAAATGGVAGSVCDTNFATSLANIGNRAFGLRTQFFLSRVAAPGSITVTNSAGGAAITGWTYDAATNSVLFTEATAPDPGTDFDVSYTAYCF